MSEWLDESTEILRIFINDLAQTPIYDDNTLEQVLLVGARYVIQEIRLTTDYTVDFLNAEISPDPSDDAVFMNFTVLKAACLIQGWKFNESAAIQGIKTRLGPAELSVNGSSNVLLALLEKGVCATYEQLKQDFHLDQASDRVRCIMSPFVSNTFLPNLMDFRRSI